MLNQKNIKNMYELSPLQKGMLFHYIKDEGSGAYFEQMTLFIDGAIDATCLEESLNGLIQKYDSLRTNFIYRQSAEQMQLVWKQRTASIHCEDIVYLTTEDQQHYIKNFQLRDRQTGFDLSRDLLIRFSLLKTAANKMVLIWSHHHILMDGWCFGILFQDLLEFYQQRLLGQPLRIGMEVPYSRYIEWLASQEEEEAAAFWANYLTGFDQMTGIPDRLAYVGKEGGVHTSQGQLSFTWNAEATLSLSRLASRLNVTLNSVFQALWGILLMRYNNSDEAVFGTVVSGRPAAIQGIETMVGLFINSIPVRIGSKDRTFEDLVVGVQRDAMDSGRYGYLSLSSIQKQASVSGLLFDHVVVFENYPLDELMMDRTKQLGFVINELDVYEQTNYPLHVLVMPGREMTVKLAYDPAVYEQEAMNNLSRHLTHLMEQVVECPDIHVEELEIITALEQKQLLALGSRITEYPRESTIQELFEQQADRTPENTALCCGNEHLTYRQLNERANQLANYMLKRGVQRSSLIGIAMERSVDLYVGLLAILKTGATYVPIDASYPQERIAYMLDDAGLSHILTHRDTTGMLPVRGQSILCVDGEREGIEAEESFTPLHACSAQDIAYVMYTSGSTGMPKGVSVTHRGVVRLVHKNDYATFDESRVFLQLAPVAFDASTFEIWGSLLNGGRLAIMPPGTPTVEQIAQAIRDYQVTTLWLTSGLFNIVVDHQLEALCGVQQLLVGGDVLSVPHVRKVLELGDIEVINGYGPTENTTFTCCYSIPPDWEGTNIPIGRPIMNTNVYVLDSRMKAVPPGIPGELYIGGDGLAQGYYGLADLTEERFVTAPERIGDSRLYRTGDLVRFLPDGNLIFMGRLDNQVKIRGYRIEPGEIETVLSQNPSVKEAVIHVTDSKQLAAYIVPEHKLAHQDATEWRRYLQDMLPEYMVPSIFVMMDSLPLNPNGKVDRKSLPEPIQPAVNDNEAVELLSEVEEQLVALWKEVLGLERLSVHDNFFELGGDSIMAIQIAARLNRKKYKLHMQDLFQNPTIAGLAPHIEMSQSEESQAEVTGEVECTPIQHWFFEQNMESPDHWNQAMLLPRKEGWNLEAVHKSLEKLLVHHDALRMEFVVEINDGQVARRQINRAIKDVKPYLRHIDLIEEKDDSLVLERMEAEANRLQRNLNLADGRLVGAALFDTYSASFLLLVIHHLVVDGVSWRILLEDFETVYDQAIANRVLTLPPKTTSYQVWSDKLHAYAESNSAKQELAYWQEVCSTVIQPLPADFEGTTDCLYRDYALVTANLDSSLTNSLLTEVHHTYHTEINDILLAALSLALKEWIGQDRLALHMEGHGRETVMDGVDLSRTVGWFTSMYPVILANEPDQGMAEAIQSVKEIVRRIPYKGIGYGILRYLSVAGQELPDFMPEISFNYLGKFNSEQASGFVHAELPLGDLVSPLSRMSHQLEINAMVIDGRFEIQFGYNSQRFHNDTINSLVECYMNQLQLCVDHCKSAKETWTPSDYGLKHLALNELAIISSSYSQPEITALRYLSPMQEGMLFHQLRNKDSQAYFEQIDFALEGEINPIYLEESVNGLIAQYDIFRTVFLYERLSRPVQVVLKERRSVLKIIDSTRFDEHEQEEFIEHLKAEDRLLGFDLSRDVLLRFTLVKQRANQYRLIWSFHHILMDGWCLGIVLNKLFELYQQRKRSQALVMEHVPSYGQYLSWLEQQDSAEAQQFWQSYLQGIEQMTSIPQQGLQADEAPFEPAEVEWRLDSKLTADLAALARSNKVTLNTVLRTVWGILLQKYNRTEDVVFGSVVSGRPPTLAGVESMVGLFINTVPVRIQSRGNDTFSELIRRVQETGASAEPYTHLSLSEIQAISLLPGGLFDHIVAFENYPLDKASIEAHSRGLGFVITDSSTFSQTNYDLNVLVLPGDELTVKVSFNKSVFTETWVGQLLQHLQTLFYQAAAQPELPISQFALVTLEEKRQLLEDFNPPSEPYPRDKAIHQLFEEQVVLVPNRPAIVCNSNVITYQQLDERANRLAHLLLQKGVACSDIVGIIAKPGVDMIVGVLGVLKASGSFLPIDPSYPPDRIAYMLEDSGTRVLLVQSELEVPSGYTDEVIVLDWEDTFEDESSLSPQAPAESNDLAYIIYTSGSTGRPKGVMVEHRSLVNLATWHNRAFEVTQEDRSTKYAGFGFDASVWEIFPYLIAGAALYIIPDEIRYDIVELNRYYEEHMITISFLPTQLAEQFMELDNRSLRLLLIGGDRAHRVRNRGYRIVNNYGPTENTVVATSHSIERFDESPPIGKPIANNRIYIVDHHNQLQPIGVPGELCIAGESLARGYLNQPERTRDSFVQDLAEQGERMYRTGDLACWRADGAIDYIGRIDHQVKIRGHRIELGEIEHQLIQLKGVREAAVIAQADQRGHSALYAYIVAGTELDMSAVRTSIEASLPSFMIPAQFIRLDVLPMTANGKLDRKALPAPELTNTDNYALPETKVERILVSVWKDVLDREEISVHDHFFELGGDSIKAIQVSARLLNDELKLEVGQLFRHPTIRQVAPYIKPLHITAEQGTVEGEVCLTPIQHWFFEQQFAQPNHWNQEMILHRPEGYHPEAVQSTFEYLMAHHDALRMSYIQTAEEVKQVNKGLSKAVLELEIFELAQRGDERSIMQEESNRLHRSLDLQQGPLVRLGLFRTSEGDYLLIIIHHLVVDALSWRILIDDFERVYDELIAGQSPSLPTKTTSYREWATRLTNYANSEELLRDIPYWSEVIGQSYPLLPADTEGSRTYHAADSGMVTLELTIRETTLLLTEAHHAYKTEINDLLLTALALTIGEWVGQNKIALDLEAHGREELFDDIDITRTIGWFTSVYPVVLHLPSNKEDLSQAIKQVKETLRQIPNKGIGFGVLKYLTSEKKTEGLHLQQTPEISFNYLGQFSKGQDEGLGTSALTGEAASPTTTCSYALLINGMVKQGKLLLTFGYNRNRHHESTIKLLAERYAYYLRVIIEYCIQQKVTELTPSDYSANSLSFEELDDIFDVLREKV
ncbi:amino acid adenylation domain-containing protein [Paenibacillus sp. QZ-Y1]|uniref:amino acid adenylation domain-containing protein n=1 Tax=Paenibacillus sp. QZ-Y1 TaxID=3414511 RepID=UPI003F79BFAE